MWWYDTKEKHQYSKASLNKVPKSFVAKVVKFKAHGLFITQEWKTAHSRNFIPSNKLIFTRLNLYSPVLIFFFFPFLLIKLFYLFLRNKQNIYTTLKSLIWCNTIYDTTHMNIKIDNIHVKPHFFQFMSVSVYILFLCHIKNGKAWLTSLPASSTATWKLVTRERQLESAPASLRGPEQSYGPRPVSIALPGLGT